MNQNLYISMYCIGALNWKIRDIFFFLSFLLSFFTNICFKEARFNALKVRRWNLNTKYFIFFRLFFKCKRFYHYNCFVFFIYSTCKEKNEIYWNRLDYLVLRLEYPSKYAPPPPCFIGLNVEYEQVLVHLFADCPCVISVERLEYNWITWLVSKGWSTTE